MYFSVKNAVKLGGKTYLPCVCYEVTRVLELTVEKLVSEGKAYTYAFKSFFVNGKRVKSKEELTAERKEEKKKHKASKHTEETKDETLDF